MDRKKMNNVTAVIPCYNDGAYIQEALDSLLNQTIVPDKIIIVDDGSYSFTLAILKRFTHPILEILYQENKGVCEARNRAIDLAATAYILTLDADDIFEPTFIEKALKVISTQNDVGAVCSYYQGIHKGKVVTEIIEPLGGGVKNFLVQNNGVGNCLLRKSCWEHVNGYDPIFDKGYEDWDFWISILKKGWRMHVIPEVLFTYRIKDVSRDQTAAALYDQELKTTLFKKHKSLYMEHLDQVFTELVYKNGRLKNKISKIQNTWEYRLGRSLLKPLRFVKNLFS
jgi:glycosyltransferase involved in cell wall biosynthesis